MVFQIGEHWPLWAPGLAPALAPAPALALALAPTPALTPTRRVLVWNMDSGVVKFTLTIARVEAMEIDQRAIYKLIFLDRRAQALCGAGADGVLRFWNVKSYGECVWEQHAGHAPGEAVVALATDAKNTMLFSGDSAG